MHMCAKCKVITVARKHVEIERGLEDKRQVCTISREADCIQAFSCLGHPPKPFCFSCLVNLVFITQLHD